MNSNIINHIDILDEFCDYEFRDLNNNVFNLVNLPEDTEIKFKIMKKYIIIEKEKLTELLLDLYIDRDSCGIITSYLYNLHDGNLCITSRPLYADDGQEFRDDFIFDIKIDNVKIIFDEWYFSYGYVLPNTNHT